MAGRPLKFKSVEEIEKKIQDYFESCFEEKWFDEPKRDEQGNKQYKDGKLLHEPVKKIVQAKPITITGLAVALNTSRQTLLNYEEREEFFDTIKGAKDFIENALEEGMLSGKINPASGIFNAKNNFNWKDKTEQDITSDGKPVSIATLIQQLNGGTKRQELEDESSLQDNRQESETNSIQEEQSSDTL